jgi:hypothetical protein
MSVEAIKRLTLAYCCLVAPLPLLGLGGTITFSGAVVSYVVATAMLCYAWDVGRVYDQRVYDKQNKRGDAS